MDHEDGAGPGSDERGEMLGVGTEIVAADVHRHRSRPAVDERLDGRHERVGLDEDLVARANACCPRAEAERIGARRDALHVLRADERRHLGFEGAQLLAIQQLHAIEHALARVEQFAPDAVILTAQLDHAHPRPSA